jgi:D-sedoheptulose 7-phosphate isomerase
MALGANAATATAWGNDYDFASLFARQTEAWGAAGGVLLGISTSGNSANVVAAFGRARGMGMTTIALTGEGGGKLGPLADHLLAVPERHTPLVQQAHIVLYHWFCGALEEALAG